LKAWDVLTLSQVEKAIHMDRIRRLRAGRLSDYGIGRGVGDLDEGSGDGVDGSRSGKEEKAKRKNCASR
jgi:hypothetical protein